eukprot:3196002-Amphidinium_carterae.2
MSATPEPQRYTSHQIGSSLSQVMLEAGFSEQKDLKAALGQGGGTDSAPSQCMPKPAGSIRA